MVYPSRFGELESFAAAMVIYDSVPLILSPHGFDIWCGKRYRGEQTSSTLAIPRAQIMSKYSEKYHWYNTDLSSIIIDDYNAIR